MLPVNGLTTGGDDYICLAKDDQPQVPKTKTEHPCTCQQVYTLIQ